MTRVSSSAVYRLRAALFGLGLAMLAAPASALPGVFVGKGKSKRVSNSTQVVMLKKGDHTVVTVWADYEGPLDKFALVLPVPPDVKLQDVTALKRDSVDHLDEITAPRFHEFWEMDPCEEGEPQQEWQRDLRVKTPGGGFLGAGMPDMSGGHKLPKEMQIDVEPQFKDGEYVFGMVPQGGSAKTFLERKGLTVSAATAKALADYEGQGMRMLVAEVMASKVELAGARRALLSPIRFATRSNYDLPSTLGLDNSAGYQELILYVLHPEKRFEVANYPNVYPPLNSNVDFSIKERMGDFYAGVHDALLAKDPKGVLVEYAWPTIKQCGEPCPNAPMMIHELLTLGADVVESAVPKADKNPPPPDLTPEEKAQLDAADKETRQRLIEQRKEVMRRRALLDRNQYVITRLHHRYTAAGLPEDIKVRAAGHIQGGLGTPEGPTGEAPTAVTDAEESFLQTRYNSFHPSKRVVHCEAPKRWRWGLPPRTYRGLRKTWTARDMAYKKRDRFVLKDVIKSAIPALGISATPAEPADVPAPKVPEASGCAIVAPAGGGSTPRLPLGVGALWLLACFRRRRGQPADA